MPTTLRKPKPKSQARIYERIENIEQAATKEFVRQELGAELEPIQRDIKWLRWIMGMGFSLLFAVMLGGFALLQSNMNYLHSDTKADMKKLETGISENRELLINLIQKR